MHDLLLSLPRERLLLTDLVYFKATGAQWQPEKSAAAIDLCPNPQSGCSQASGSLDCRSFDECEQIRIDHVGIRGHHAVRESRVNLQRALLEQFGLQQ